MSNIGRFNPSQNFQANLRPDSQALQSVFANTGQQGNVAKTVAQPGLEQPGDLHNLSPAALQSLLDPGKLLQEHGAELAEQAGLTQTSHRDQEQGVESKLDREREQAELGKPAIPDGYVEVAGSNGTRQVMTVEDKANLTRMDDPRQGAERVLGDIPKASLSAAQAVVKSQNLKSKKPQMKSDPAVDQAASQFERHIAPLLAAPLGNREPGNDRHGQPVPTLEE